MYLGNYGIPVERSNGEHVLEKWEVSMMSMLHWGTLGGIGGDCFFNVLVVRRNLLASTPSLVPRMSDVTRPSEALIGSAHRTED